MPPPSAVQSRLNVDGGGCARFCPWSPAAPPAACRSAMPMYIWAAISGTAPKIWRPSWLLQMPLGSDGAGLFSTLNAS